jgi:hypothetical protein
MSELTIEEQMQAAMKESAAASKALADAKAKLSPLEEAAHSAATKLNEIILKFQVANGFVSAGPTKKKRVMKAYNITNESKIARSGKAAYTRTINGGGSEKDAKAAQKSAEAALKTKLGVA